MACALEGSLGATWRIDFRDQSRNRRPGGGHCRCASKGAGGLDQAGDGSASGNGLSVGDLTFLPTLSCHPGRAPFAISILCFFP